MSHAPINKIGSIFKLNFRSNNNQIRKNKINSSFLPKNVIFFIQKNVATEI